MMSVREWWDRAGDSVDKLIWIFFRTCEDFLTQEYERRLNGDVVNSDLESGSFMYRISLPESSIGKKMDSEDALRLILDEVGFLRRWGLSFSLHGPIIMFWFKESDERMATLQFLDRKGVWEFRVPKELVNNEALMSGLTVSGWDALVLSIYEALAKPARPQGA